MRHIIFDLDGTLIVHYLDHTKYPKQHLTKSRHQILGKPFYILHVEQMSKIFFNLLNSPEFSIAFLTASSYPRDEVLFLLECEYGLPHGSFNSCFYINRDNVDKREWMNKGEVMANLCGEQQLIASNSILVDDTEFHINNAEENGFTAIYADSWREYPKYLTELNHIIMPVHNTPFTPLFNKKPECTQIKKPDDDPMLYCNLDKDETKDNRRTYVHL